MLPKHVGSRVEKVEIIVPHVLARMFNSFTYLRRILVYAFIDIVE